MNILLIAPQPFYSERGTPIAVRALLEELAAAGHRLDVLTYHDGQDLSIPGTRIIRASRPPLVGRVPIGPSWQKAACDASLFRLAARLVRRHRYDLIHAVEEGAFIARHLHRRFRIPYIYDMDSLMSEQLRDKGLPFAAAAPGFAALEHLAIRHAAGILAVCPFLVDHARRRALPGTPVQLLPDFPLEGVEGATPDQEIAGIGGLKFVYVGNLEPYQGVDLMLQAFASLAPHCPEAKLIIAGGNPNLVARYRSNWKHLIGQGRLHLLGRRPSPQLGPILAAADVLVSPRLQGNNTPMKIYSYLASGRPILATDLPTHRQVLDPSTALLVRPAPDSLAAGMQQLAGDPALRQQLGQAAAELARTQYSRAAFRTRLLEFYSRIPFTASRGLASRPKKRRATRAVA